MSGKFRIVWTTRVYVVLNNGKCSRSLLVFHLGEVSLQDSLFSIVVRVPGYRSRDPSSIPGATGFSEK
jgi:hypothetical protein